MNNKIFIIKTIKYFHFQYKICDPFWFKYYISILHNIYITQIRNLHSVFLSVVCVYLPHTIFLAFEACVKCFVFLTFVDLTNFSLLGDLSVNKFTKIFFGVFYTISC